MIMAVAASVVPSRSVPRGQLGRDAGGDERLKGFVDSRQANVGDRRFNALIDFFRRRVPVRIAEVGINSLPLRRASPAATFKSLPQCFRLERTVAHRVSRGLLRCSIPGGGRETDSNGNVFLRTIVRTLDASVNSLVDLKIKTLCELSSCSSSGGLGTHAGRLK